MRLKATQRPQPVIPTASMADIAFLLIIFFMVTTVHEADRTSVNLPLAQKRTESEKGAAIVVLGKDKDGSLLYKFSDGKQMSVDVGGPEALYHEASAITYRDSTTQFILKADGDVKFEKIDELLDTLRRADVQNVLLLSQAKGGKSGGGEGAP